MLLQTLVLQINRAKIRFEHSILVYFPNFLYKTDPEDPCFCCKEKTCPDKGCSNYGENYTCFAAQEVDLAIMDCAPLDMEGLSLCNDGIFSQNPCRCCQYKKKCTDVGCSTQNPGYQCMNELDAAEHPIPCMQHDKSLCDSSEGKYIKKIPT